jgi:hypothetical protein
MGYALPTCSACHPAWLLRHAIAVPGEAALKLAIAQAMVVEPSTPPRRRPARRLRVGRDGMFPW